MNAGISSNVPDHPHYTYARKAAKHFPLAIEQSLAWDQVVSENWSAPGTIGFATQIAEIIPSGRDLVLSSV